MTAAERKQLQRAREADQARRREPLDAKLQRAQALAEQLLANAKDIAAKLASERNVSITTRDIARYLIGLGETNHVRAALAGKSVPARATESVTSNVTDGLNVTFDVTVFDDLVCCLCPKRWGEVDHMLIIAGRKARGVVAVCNECSQDKADARVTDDVTQDDDA
jgi:hypothetical protein